MQALAFMLGHTETLIAAALPTQDTTTRKENNPGPVPLLFASEQSLSYLTGELPADYGFDPLGLLDPEGKSEGFVSPAWLQYSEVIHARCAPCHQLAMLHACACMQGTTH
jgi:light-harvesting complex I chlorophyll a/b binding protein 3